MKAIEEAGFSGIGASKEQEGPALLKLFALGVGVGEFSDVLGESVHLVKDQADGSIEGRIEFFGEVDPAFDADSESEGAFGKLIEVLFEVALEVASCDVQGLFIFGGDQIDNGLCTGEIEATVEKSASSEFARLCGTCAKIEDDAQDLQEVESPTVHLKLDHVVARIRASFRHPHAQAFVQDRARSVAALAEIHTMRLPCCGGDCALKDDLGDVTGFWAADAQDADATFSDGGGDGGDGVVG